MSIKISPLGPTLLALLTPGTHIIAHVTRDSNATVIAERITIGKNGLIPPV